jgi:mannose-6-phosphate isomerase
MKTPIPSLFTFSPAIRNYVWGGQSLIEFADAKAAKSGLPIAEIWVLYEENKVTNGVFAGKTLAELASSYPEEVLGRGLAAGGGERFPLLIKLLDCANWLSLQVHPNDEQAVKMEGPTFMGKTEAWHILKAEPEAKLIAGIKPGTTLETLHAAIGNEGILELVEYHSVEAGDTVFMPAGTIHALGPGLLVYEVQQTSDLTFRVFDWNRPQNNGRVLHVEKSIAVTDPNSQGKIDRVKENGAAAGLVQCSYFKLEKLTTTQERDTRGESFHAITVIAGECTISTKQDRVTLKKFDSALVSAVCGKYTLEGDFQVLCSSLPG